MKEYKIRKYSKDDYSAWNNFIAGAKNATFLFHRDFMEYHADRFEDFSLVISNKNKIVAVLAAHVSGDELYSHNGLTYGGIVLGQTAKLPEVIDVFRYMLRYLSEAGIQKLHLKIIPDIYLQKPSDEILYALFLANATLTRRDSLSVIDQSIGYKPSVNRKQCIVRGEKSNLTIREEADFADFWNKILIPNLDQKHGAAPVHSLAEITRLKKLFPDAIRQFNVYHHEQIVAGTTIFVSANVAHAQYISGDANSNKLNSIDYLYNHLISVVFSDKRYFDFGISNEMNGRKLNKNLLFWKESFGAATVVQDFYTVETDNFHLLENVTA